jgi:tetratricopeptide (TPR) repeat protein
LAAAEAVAASDPDAQGFVFEAWGNAFAAQGDSAGALRAHTASAGFREATWGETLLLARSLARLGDLGRGLQEWSAVEAYHRRALAIRERIAPGSVLVAQSLVQLGNGRAEQGDLQGAIALLQTAIELLDRESPLGDEMFGALRSLGGTYYDAGILDLSRLAYDAALRLPLPRSSEPLTADLLGRLGQIEEDEDRPEAATAYYDKALKIWERVAPNSQTLALALDRLGNSARLRGNPGDAQKLYQRSLDIRLAIAPREPGVVGAYLNLGGATLETGKRNDAEKWFRAGISLADEAGWEGAELANLLSQLGQLRAAANDLPEAEAHLTRAVEIWTKFAEGSAPLAVELGRLGLIMERKRDYSQAEAQYVRALQIWDAVSPTGEEAASVLDRLIAVTTRSGNAAKAGEYRIRRSRIGDATSPRQ